MKTKILSILALLLTVIVGEVQAQKSLPSKHGFEQNGKSANARGGQSATTAQTPSRRSVLRAPSTDALAPTDVAVRGITPTSATVSWNGTGDSYNLRYRKYYRTIIFSEGFESCSHGELPAGWTALDADGDGHSWFAYDYSKDPKDKNGNPNSFDKMCVESESYLNGPLTPDNWLISPQVPLEGKLSLWAKGVDPDWAAEHFAIYLSTTGKDVADFTTVLIPETAAKGVLTEYTADLSAYAGQVGYIAIRHFNVTDMYQLAVDNITITDEGTPIPTYTVTLKESTEDATSWQGKAGTGDYQELPLTGLEAGTAVTVTYTGSKKVIGVKAEKKAAAPASNPLDNTTTAWSAGTFVVPAGGLTYGNAITVSGDVTLVLTDGETLTLNKGISLASGATLTIEGNGTMNVNGTNYSTASTVAGSTGTLILTSGTLTATGGNGGSVGDDGFEDHGGNGGDAINGSVIVSGGTLTARGGNGGSVGIDCFECSGGNGGDAISGTLTINGGSTSVNNGSNGSIGDLSDECTAGKGGKAVAGTVTDNR